MKNLILLAIMVFVFGCHAEQGPEESSKQESFAPLPESMKGYELYSWAANGTWHFTLITGTNRNKTHHEIIAEANTVEGSFIKITAEGVSELKTLLALIPEGQSILWIANPMMVEGFEMPERKIVDDVEVFCHSAGLDLQLLP